MKRLVFRRLLKTLGAFLAALALTVPCEAADDFVRFIPAAASVEGRFGTEWTTDLWLVGRAAGTPAPVEVEISLMDDIAGGDPMGVTVQLPSRPSMPLHIPDVVHSLLNHRGAGALLLRSSEPFDAWSRTTTRSPSGGRVGQDIAALAAGDLPCGPTGVVSGVANDPSAGGARTNVGVFNPAARTGTFQATLLDSQGDILGIRRIAVPSYGWTQFDVFEATNNAATQTSDADLRLFSDPRMAIYVSVVDNASGDASFRRPMSMSDPRPGPPDPCAFELCLWRSGEAVVDGLAYTEPPGVPRLVPAPSADDWQDTGDDQEWCFRTTVPMVRGDTACVVGAGSLDSGTIGMQVDIDCPNAGGSFISDADDSGGSFRLEVCAQLGSPPDCDD